MCLCGDWVKFRLPDRRVSYISYFAMCCSVFTQRSNLASCSPSMLYDMVGEGTCRLHANKST